MLVHNSLSLNFYQMNIELNLVEVCVRSTALVYDHCLFRSDKTFHNVAQMSLSYQCKRDNLYMLLAIFSIADNDLFVYTIFKMMTIGTHLKRNTAVCFGYHTQTLHDFI